MRGKPPSQPSMLALVSMESLVPTDHPLRAVKALAGEVLRELDPVFERMYSNTGRPSVAPERLLLSMLLMALYGVRSERMFCEQLRYNMLFRWFLDMSMMDTPFDASTFSHNRDRLLDHDVGRQFFAAVVRRASAADLLSRDHFSVDGTLIEAWGSPKSFRVKEGDTQDNKGFVDFRGETRTNDTHESKTDPDARLYRKGPGREAKLSHMAHVLIENRNGLVVDAEVTEATGTAERDAALTMLWRERERRDSKRKDQRQQRKKNRKYRRITLAADKSYDTRDFVRRCRELRVTPHVARFAHARRRSSIDARTTRHPGYRMSTTARMLVEKVFGWLKTHGGLRRTRFRGRTRTAAAAYVTLAAYNLLRISNLERLKIS
jgi:transposase